MLRCKACVDFLPDSPRCVLLLKQGGPQNPRFNGGGGGGWGGAHTKTRYPDLAADKSWDPKELFV